MSRRRDSDFRRGRHEADEPNADEKKRKRRKRYQQRNAFKADANKSNTAFNVLADNPARDAADVFGTADLDGFGNNSSYSTFSQGHSSKQNNQYISSYLMPDIEERQQPGHEITMRGVEFEFKRNRDRKSDEPELTRKKRRRRKMAAADARTESGADNRHASNGSNGKYHEELSHAGMLFENRRHEELSRTETYRTEERRHAEQRNAEQRNAERREAERRETERRYNEHREAQRTQESYTAFNDTNAYSTAAEKERIRNDKITDTERAGRSEAEDKPRSNKTEFSRSGHTASDIAFDARDTGDVQFGVHEKNTRSDAKKGGINTEFEMKRANSSKEKAAAADAEEARKKRGRRQARRAASETDTEYDSLNAADAYGTAGLKQTAEETQAAESKSAYNAQNRKEAERMRAANQDYEFTARKGDTEFRTSDNGDVRFGAKKSDSGFKLGADKSDFEFRRSSDSRISEENTDIGQKKTERRTGRGRRSAAEPTEFGQVSENASAGTENDFRQRTVSEVLAEKYGTGGKQPPVRNDGNDFEFKRSAGNSAAAGNREQYGPGRSGQNISESRSNTANTEKFHRDAKLKFERGSGAGSETAAQSDTVKFQRDAKLKFEHDGSINAGTNAQADSEIKPQRKSYKLRFNNSDEFASEKNTDTDSNSAAAERNRAGDANTDAGKSRAKLKDRQRINFESGQRFKAHAGAGSSQDPGSGSFSDENTKSGSGASSAAYQRAKKRAEKYEEKLKKAKKKQPRHNRLRFERTFNEETGKAETKLKRDTELKKPEKVNPIFAQTLVDTAGRLRSTVLSADDDNAGLETADKIGRLSDRAIMTAYRRHKNKPYRMQKKVSRLKYKLSREQGRMQYEEMREQTDEKGKEKQKAFYKKNAQRAFYKKAYSRALIRRSISKAKDLAKKIAKKLIEGIKSFISAFGVKAAVIAAAVVIVLLVAVQAFTVLITAIGGYVEENVTTAEEIGNIGGAWRDMEDELLDDYFAEAYPGYEIQYYGLENVGTIDMQKLMAYYNAKNGKTVYSESVASLEDLFNEIYTWDLDEIIYNEGTPDEERVLLADLYVENIDDLIDSLSEEEKEIYEACLEVYREEEEYDDIWSGLVS